MRRVAPDHAAERDDAREPACLRERHRPERKLERAGHGHHRDRVTVDAAASRARRARSEQPGRDLAVEARHDDAHRAARARRLALEHASSPGGTIDSPGTCSRTVAETWSLSATAGASGIADLVCLLAPGLRGDVRSSSGSVGGASRVEGRPSSTLSLDDVERRPRRATARPRPTRPRAHRRRACNRRARSRSFVSALPVCHVELRIESHALMVHLCRSYGRAFTLCLRYSGSRRWPRSRSAPGRRP